MHPFLSVKQRLDAAGSATCGTWMLLPMAYCWRAMGPCMLALHRTLLLHSHACARAVGSRGLLVHGPLHAHFRCSTATHVPGLLPPVACCSMSPYMLALHRTLPRVR